MFTIIEAEGLYRVIQSFCYLLEAIYTMNRLAERRGPVMGLRLFFYA